MVAISSGGVGSRVGTVILSILVEKKVVKLDSQNFPTSFQEVFSTLNADQQAKHATLIGRLNLWASPQAACIADTSLTQFLGEFLREVPAHNTVKSALQIKMLFLFADHPAQRNGILFLWNCIICKISSISISQKDWKVCPDLERLYKLLPLLQDVQLQQLLPNHPIIGRELPNEELQEVYQFLRTQVDACSRIARETSSLLKIQAKAASSLPRSSGSLVECSAYAIQQCIHACKQFKVFSDNSFAPIVLPENIREHRGCDHKERSRGDALFWASSARYQMSSLYSVGNCLMKFASELVAAYLPTMQFYLRSMLAAQTMNIMMVSTLEDDLHKIKTKLELLCYVSTNVCLLSDALRKQLDEQLSCTLYATGAEEADILAREALVDLLDALEQRKEQRTQPLIATTKKRSDKKNRGPQKASPAAAASSAVDGEKKSERPEPRRLTVTEQVQEQLRLDLVCLGEREDLIGSITPFAATLSQYMSMRGYPKEVSDHLFLMTQGIELFLQCARDKQYNLLPAVLRAIMIDAHVAMEQYFAYQITSSGGAHPYFHDLAVLAKAAGFAESEKQLDYFRENNLLIYWMRYPTCSEWYFGQKEKPYWLQQLLYLSNRKIEQCDLTLVTSLCNFYIEALKVIVPDDVDVEGVGNWLSVVASEIVLGAAPPMPPSRLQAMGSQIRSAIDGLHYTGRKPTFLRPIGEVLYYLEWIEQAEHLATIYRHPTLEFWYQRYQLELDKLFKQLYTFDSLLQGERDIDTHRIDLIMQQLTQMGIRKFPPEVAHTLCRLNMRTALHYHTHSSPLQEECEHLLEKCQLLTHNFVPRANRQITWPSFDKAMQIFEQHLKDSLQALSKLASAEQKIPV